MLRYSGVKSFGSGVSNTSNTTADEYRSISMYLPFFLRGVDVEYSVSVQADLGLCFLENLASLYISWRWLVGLDHHDDDSLNILDLFGQELQEGIETLRRVAKQDEDYIVNEGPKYHSILHWSHWIRRYGATGNYDTEIFELAHRLTLKIWCQKLYMRGNYAEKKVLQRYNTFRDIAHPNSTLLPRNTRNNWGIGGLRGRVDIWKLRSLDAEKVSEARTYEKSHEFGSDSVEAMFVMYSNLLDALSHDERELNIPLFIAVLESSKDFHNHLMDLCGDYDGNQRKTYFCPSSKLNVTMWRKSYHKRLNRYLTAGSFILYHSNLKSTLRHRSRVQLGCVRWMFSVDENQYMVIQKMRLIACNGVISSDDNMRDWLKEFVLRFRQRDPDKMRTLFQYFRMSDESVFGARGSFEIVTLDGYAEEDM
jgi:hypothetical protein